MTLKEQITEDMKAAMRAKDTERLGTIRLLLAAVQAARGGRTHRARRRRRCGGHHRQTDQAAQRLGGRLCNRPAPGSGRQGKAEIKVLQAYLPQRMSADEVLAAVKAIVVEIGASGPGDMGKVMGVVKTRLAGKAEMSAVSAAVKAALAS
jgi:uncharacterized protein YqeY